MYAFRFPAARCSVGPRSGAPDRFFAAPLAALSLGVAFALCGVPIGAAAQVRAVQPGAPGAPTRALTESELADVEGPPHTDEDVAFMQGMIVHHQQAIDMVELVAGRTDSEDIRLLAHRIALSQVDEIGLMERWLEARDESVALPGMTGMEGMGGAMGAGGGMMADGHQHMMPGMLTPEQMMALEAANGPEFDRLFLEYMIQHHRGALVMVNDLYSSAGSGQEEEISQFASHVEADQSIEIRRMNEMLGKSP